MTIYIGRTLGEINRYKVGDLVFIAGDAWILIYNKERHLWRCYSVETATCFWTDFSA